MTVTDLHHLTMYSFFRGLSLESPPKKLKSLKIVLNTSACSHMLALALKQK